MQTFQNQGVKSLTISNMLHLKPPPKYSIATMQWGEKLFGHFNFLGSY